MINNNFITAMDQTRLEWLKNFSDKFNYCAYAFDFTEEDVSNVLEDVKKYESLLNDINTFLNSLQKSGVFINAKSKDKTGLPLLPIQKLVEAELSKSIFARIDKIIDQIITHPYYTEAIGAELNIQSGKNLNISPTLSHVLESGTPVIKWKKYAGAQTDIYVDRAEGENFTFLASTTQNSFIDTFKLPPGVDTCTWHYIAVYSVNNQPIGFFSDPISISVLNRARFRSA